MNATHTLPACCSPLDDHWPLPVPLAHTVLLSTRFDPAHLAGDDFQRSAIAVPPSIQRSVAKRQAEFLAGRLCARAALHQPDGFEQHVARRAKREDRGDPPSVAVLGMKSCP